MSLPQDFYLFRAQKASNILKLIIFLSIVIWKSTSRTLIIHISINIWSSSSSSDKVSSHTP